MADSPQDSMAAALRQMAHHTPAAQVIERFCGALEQQLPGAVVGVTVLDRAAKLFEQAFFPSLPPTFASATCLSRPPSTR